MEARSPYRVGLTLHIDGKNIDKAKIREKRDSDLYT